VDVTEISWTPFGESTSYRLIISRIKRGINQEDLFSGGAYTCRAIMTNDKKTSPKQIIDYYNKRGASERIFDVMTNDFGWSKLPCPFLSVNTAFMIIMAGDHC